MQKDYKMDFSVYVIDLLEKKAKDKDIPMGKACILANVTPATFSNWRHGHSSPVLKKVQAIFDAIEAYQPNLKENPNDMHKTTDR